MGTKGQDHPKSKFDGRKPTVIWEQIGLAVFLAIAASGCVSKSRAKADAQKAMLEGQRRGAILQQQAQEPVVWFHGAISNPRVPWTEDLTLAQALLAANYTGTLSPKKIQVIRQGHSYSIDVRRLLNGTENPLMEPGDIVEVVR